MLSPAVDGVDLLPEVDLFASGTNVGVAFAEVSFLSLTSVRSVLLHTVTVLIVFIPLATAEVAFLAPCTLAVC